MRWFGWLESKSLEVGIAASLAIGMIAAYARERHEGRNPDRPWLINRVLLMPFLALAAAAGIDTFGLPTRVAMFATALLSLLAFDALRAIAARGLRKIAGDEVDLRVEAAVAKAGPVFVDQIKDAIPVRPDNAIETRMLRILDETDPLDPAR